MPVTKTDLRRIGRDELVVGKTLRGDVRDAEGRILLSAGEVLQPHHVRVLADQLAAGVYAGPDWDASGEAAAESPGDVIEQVFRRHGSRQPTQDQRAHARHPWAVPLTLMIEEHGEYGVLAREIEVVTADISRAGFAFHFRQYIAQGTRVRVQFDSLPNNPRLQGVVRNCRLVGGTQHRVGVQFTGNDALAATV